MSGTRRARVIAVGRSAAWIVVDGDGEPRLARLRKLSRHAFPAPGDLVECSELGDGEMVVDALLPRSFALVRKTAGGRTKTMAANVDTLAIVAALVEPALHLGMVDRLVAFAVQHEVGVWLVLTKADLAGEDAVARIAAIYAPAAVPVMVLNPKTGRGMDDLRAALVQRHVLLVGNSGVGKSSIFKALGGTGVVGDLSRFGAGKQTTTSARLFEMPDGFLIDSPGIGEFELDPLPPDEIGWLFVELREPATRCRFRNCRHLEEPDCAVRAAVATGTIASSRYASYRELALNDAGGRT